MKIRSFIRMPQTKVYPDTPLEKVWKLLSQRHIFLLPVVSEKNILLGVIEEEDLLYRLIPDYRDYFSEFFSQKPDISDLEDRLEHDIILTAKDVVRKPVVSISSDQDIFKALSKLMAYHFRQLLVVDEGKFVGLIFEDDIVNYLLEKHKHIVKRHKKTTKKK